MSDDTISKDNVELSIEKTINKYTEKGRILEVMLWNTLIGILKDKYGFGDKYKAELKKQRTTEQI